MLRRTDGVINLKGEPMDDLIDRQAAIDALGVFTQADALGHTPKQIVEALPPAQPEIVRCKDCRNNHWCNIQEAAMAGDNFFCGAAERRIDE